MRKAILLSLFVFCTLELLAQLSSPNYAFPPTAQSVRAMAEWEELEALVVTWTNSNTGFHNIIKQIIQHAQQEVKVIVICNDSNQVINHLTASNIYTSNVEFVEDFYNSVWIRDYGASTIYANDVDSLYLVDWIYNRPRPFDDRIPSVIAEHLDISLYSTTHNPYNLVNIGGNFMSDGQGTAFASRLILDENGPQGAYTNTPKTEQEIDSIMNDFMGIHTFIKPDLLNFNPINHIDMYMKLLNEETLLVGEYPNGTADGPKIEANVQFIKNNYQTTFGTPFKIVRIPMPPDTCGNYPNYFGSSCLSGSVNNYWGHYRTYTNIVFVNKTVLVPIYSFQYDTTALNILRKELPGYNVVGIDCNEMISYYGALHCITKAVGVKNPLLIVHQPIRDTIFESQGYQVISKIQHADQIKDAHIFYTTDLSQGYTSVNMNHGVGNYWVGNIPAQPVGSTVYYYIKAKSFSGKIQVRPLPAPAGYWKFKVEQTTNVENLPQFDFALESVYPNPTGDKIYIPVKSDKSIEGKITLYNIAGQELQIIYQGRINNGVSLYESTIHNLPNGTYLVVLETEFGKQSQKIVVAKE